MCARIVALVRDIIFVEITEFCRRAEEEHLIRVLHLLIAVKVRTWWHSVTLFKHEIKE